MTVDIEHLRGWIGRTETVEDEVTVAPLRGLTATLDRDDAPQRAGDPVPPCWHWLYFLHAHPFNGHRIRYDRRYVTTVEGYPGLVVHGPLIATLLLDLLRRHLPQARVGTFSFKAMKPIFDVAPFELCGRRETDSAVKLWARTPEGDLAMDAGATLA